MLVGISAAAVVIVVLLVYFFRASDPASRPPVPYKKFDYGAHMQQQMRQFDRQTPSASGPSQSGRPTPP
jgi:hypothetical protein